MWLQYLYERHKGLQEGERELFKHVESNAPLGMDGREGSHALALYSMFQPVTLFPYPLNGLIHLHESPK